VAKFTDERVSAVLQGPRRFRIIDFPGHEELKVAVRCLTEAELDGADVEAQYQLRQKAKSRGWSPESYVMVDSDMLARLTQREAVARAFFDAETVGDEQPEPFFSSASELEGLDCVTFTKLYDAYLEHQAFVSPLHALDDDEDVKELVEGLKKARTPEVYLGGYEHSMLRRSLIFLVCEARSETSPTNKSSTGPS